MLLARQFWDVERGSDTSTSARWDSISCTRMTKWALELCGRAQALLPAAPSYMAANSLYDARMASGCGRTGIYRLYELPGAPVAIGGGHDVPSSWNER